MTNRTPVPSEFTSEPMVTEPQDKFLRSLIAERDLSSLNDQQRNWLLNYEQNKAKLTKRKASGIIETLLSLGKKPKGQVGQGGTFPDLPAGRYAVDNEDGELRFYKLDKPTEGRWAGYVFLSVMASDERHPIKSFAAKKTIMEKIAEDPQGAMNRYGEEIGACGVCGRTLTNKDSRARGIGPICAAKYRDDYGWWT